MKNKLLNLIITTLLIVSSFTINTVNAKTDITSNSNNNNNTNEVLDNSYNTALPSDIIKSNTPQYIDDDLENTTIVSGKKTWVDKDNKDQLRPDSITINLLANGEPALDDNDQPIKIEVTENDEWQYTFNNLPKYDDNDNLITYSVSEDKIEGYIAEYEGNNIINRQVISIKGKKYWDDFDNVEGLRPESLTITLYKNSETFDTKTITEDDNWEYEFNDLLVYDELGKRNRYSVFEQFSPYYGDYEIYNDFHNVLTRRKKDIKIIKINEEGKVIPNAKFNIYEHMTLVSTSSSSDRSLEYVDPNTNWNEPNKYSLFPRGGFAFYFEDFRFVAPTKTKIFTDIPKLNEVAIGAAISIYTPLLKFNDGTTLLEFLDEHGRIPFENEYTIDDIDFVNTEWHMIEVTDFAGLRNTIADGYHFSVAEDVSEIALNKDPFKELDRDVYVIAHAILDGNYHPGTTAHYPEELVLKVRKLIEDRYMGKIELEKYPIDYNEYIYSRHLIGEFTTDEKGEINLNDLYWSYRGIVGSSYPVPEYVVREIMNPNLVIIETDTASDKYVLDPTEYTIDISKEDEIVITNKYVTTDITINKKWIDNDNKDKSRPDSIEVNVLANDEVVKTITLSKDEDYSYTLENMPKYKDGELIKYTIEEVKVPDNYEVSYEIDQENYTFTITNTYHKQKPEPKPDPKPTPKPSYDIPKTGVD